MQNASSQTQKDYEGDIKQKINSGLCSNRYKHDELIPQAIMEAICDIGLQFDAIIVDEGQDFIKQYWDVLDLLLSNSEETFLYVFYDPNQLLFTEKIDCPFFYDKQEFLLTNNCRNTKNIHTFGYQFLDNSQTGPPELEGVPVTPHMQNGIVSQAKIISEVVTSFIEKEEIDPKNILVQVVNQFDIRKYCEHLMEHPLPKSVSWKRTCEPEENTVRIKTATKFKGLEAPIVLLWGIENTEDERWEEKIYVASTRAISELHIIGSSNVFKKFSQELSL